jgi:hypothetical protein
LCISIINYLDLRPIDGSGEHILVEKKLRKDDSKVRLYNKYISRATKAFKEKLVREYIQAILDDYRSHQITNICNANLFLPLLCLLGEGHRVEVAGMVNDFMRERGQGFELTELPSTKFDSDMNIVDKPIRDGAQYTYRDLWTKVIESFKHKNFLCVIQNDLANEGIEA